jgi:hypothetical protein
MKARIIKLENRFEAQKNIFYDVQLDNKTVGKLVVDPNDDNYSVGSEINYESETAQSKAGKSYTKIKVVKADPAPQNNANQPDNSPYQINRVVYEAPSKAIDIAATSLAGSNPTDEKLLSRAEVIYDWIAGKLEKLTK